MRVIRAIRCLPGFLYMTFLFAVMVWERAPWYLDGVALLGAVIAGMRWTL